MLLLNNWRARTGFMTLLLVIGGFLFLPIVWMLLTSIKPEGEVFVRIPTILPHVPTLENYRALFSHSETAMQLCNSLITAGGGALLTVALSTYAAYSFAKFRYFGRKPLMFLMLLLVIGGFLFLPIVWMLLTSIKPEGEVFVRIPSVLPHAPTLENYRALFATARPRCNCATA